MSPNGINFLPADEEFEPQELRERLELINRLHMALRSSIHPDDLLHIILAVLISDMGLRFDHAFFLQYNPLDKTLIGKKAFGCADFERDAAIRREIADEQIWLNNRVASAPSSEKTAAPFASIELRGLHSNAFWVETVLKYLEEKELEEAIKGVKILCEDERASRALCEFIRKPNVSAITLNGDRCPPQLRDLVGEPALAAPLFAGEHLHGIIIADLRFSEQESILQALQTLFEWFVVQASGALEHALQYGQKQDAVEHLLEIESIKSNFLSTISHELRTPLTAILGFTQALLANRAGPLTDQQKSFLQKVQRHTNHLNDMVNDLLELAEASVEVTSGEELKPVDPLAALMRVVPPLEHRRASKKVVIEPVITEKIPPVLATEKTVERILFHILDNAVKFSPLYGKVFVRFHPIEGHLRVEIQDQGIGFEEENLKKIFQGFFQVDNRLSRSYEGLGIGLTLTKKLLMAIGGAIDVRSRPGEGTTVAIEFRTPFAENSDSK